LSKYYVLKEGYDKIAIGESGSIRIYRKYNDYNSIDSYETLEATRTEINLFEARSSRFIVFPNLRRIGIFRKSLGK
jgi:hypothetical protein